MTHFKGFGISDTWCSQTLKNLRSVIQGLILLLRLVTSLKSSGWWVERDALPCLKSCLGPPSSSLWTTENRLEHLEAGISEADTYPGPHRKCLTLESQVVDPDPEKARWGPPAAAHRQSAILAMLALAPWWNQVRQGGCTAILHSHLKENFNRGIMTAPPCLQKRVPQLRLMS